MSSTNLMHKTSKMKEANPRKKICKNEMPIKHFFYRNSLKQIEIDILLSTIFKTTDLFSSDMNMISFFFLFYFCCCCILCFVIPFGCYNSISCSIIKFIFLFCLQHVVHVSFPLIFGFGNWGNRLWDILGFFFLLVFCERM